MDESVRLYGCMTFILFGICFKEILHEMFLFWHGVKFDSLGRSFLKFDLKNDEALLFGCARCLKRTKNYF